MSDHAQQFMYVMVRTDLPQKMQPAQAIHAAVLAAHVSAAHPDNYVILLRAKNVDRLERDAAKVSNTGIRVFRYYEPDGEYAGFTAWAAEAVDPEHRKVFKGFQSWPGDQA